MPGNLRSFDLPWNRVYSVGITSLAVLFEWKEDALIRASSRSLMVLAIVLPVVSCFCWVPIQAEACHSSAEMADCCCNEQGISKGGTTDLIYVLPCPTPKLPELQGFAVLQHSVSLQTTLFIDREPTASHLRSRSFPSLYLLNSSFLL